METLAERLYRELASHLTGCLGWCPTHLTPLICALCDMEWVGTFSEEQEIDRLTEQMVATGGEVESQGACHSCGKDALCPDCYLGSVGEPADAGLTPEERARFWELAVHLVPMRGPNGHTHGAGRGPHEEGETP
jgi:hypothetical protein